MNNEKIDSDIRDNKVKEGMLLKQSRHLKEWKERWMVLTKTYLYSFSSKGQYKDPTEIISLKDIQTIKSYYKDQYKKPYTFRVESQQVNLHMSAKNSDEKWAWMTALEKMIQRVIHPQNNADTYNLIRETIKMSTAVRQTLQKKQQKQRKRSIDFTDNLLKKMRLALASQTINCQIKTSKMQSAQESKVAKIEQKQEKKAIIKPQRQVQVRERVIEKIVYKDRPKSQIECSLLSVLKQLTLKPSQNPRPLINFVVYLLTSKLQHYQPEVLEYCFDAHSRRFFAQVFLLMMNQETEQGTINNYIKFIIVLYQHCNQYFYSSDLKALIGILIRQIQMNRSEFNQYLIMVLIKELTEKDWWIGLNFRRNDLKNLIKEIGAISGPENHELANLIYSKI